MVAIQTLFIVIVIGMIIVFSIIVLNAWLKGESTDVIQLSCGGQKVDYCLKWQRDGGAGSSPPSGWNPMENCEKPTDFNRDCLPSIGGTP